MPMLTYYDFDKVEKTIEIGTEPVLIGRATDCQIRTEDAVVSRRHARILLDGGEYWIEDLGSLSGVYLGAEKITRARFVPGDLIVMGSLVIRMLPPAMTNESSDAAGPVIAEVPASGPPEPEPEPAPPA